MRISRIRLYLIASEPRMHSRVPCRVLGIPPGVSFCLARVPASISVQSMNFLVGFPQAVLLASYEDIDPAGVLRSTGVTPLRRYYDPLRPPTTPHGGYCFPSWVVSSHALEGSRLVGSLRFLG